MSIPTGLNSHTFIPMDGSHKNVLQEYFQKRRVALPNYSHERQDNASWRSEVRLVNGSRFEAVGWTKKEADQHAAQLALASIEVNHELQQKSTQQIDWQFPGCVLVLIDLENSPGFTAEKWKNIQWDCSRVEAFVGKLSSHATKNLSELYPFVDEFYIIDSGIQDAVDHAISLRAGQWVESLKHKDYYINSAQGCVFDDGIYIVSRDRFAVALSDILRQAGQNVVHAINIDSCFEELAKKSKKE